MKQKKKNRKTTQQKKVMKNVKKAKKIKIKKMKAIRYKTFVQCILVVTFISCTGNAQELCYNIYLMDEKIQDSKCNSSIDIREDTSFFNRGGQLLTYKSAEAENPSMLLFLEYRSDNGYQVVEIDSLPADYLDFDFFGFDFDKNGTLEVVAIWKEESTFFVTIYQWFMDNATVRVSKLYQSGDLGIPEKWHGRKYEVIADMVFIYYQKANGEHFKSQLINHGDGFKLEEIR